MSIVTEIPNQPAMLRKGHRLLYHTLRQLENMHTHSRLPTQFATKPKTWDLSNPTNDIRGLNTSQLRRSSLITTRAASSSTSKSKQMYVCKDCGETTLQWSGQCMSCKTFGTLEKVVLSSASTDGGGGGGGARAAARYSAAIKSSSSSSDLNSLNNSNNKIITSPSSSSLPSLPQQRRISGPWVLGAEGESPERLSDITARVSDDKKSGRGGGRIKLPGPAGEEMNRVLGGGLVPGSLILVGGEPGVGKSTLLLQLTDALTRAHNGTTDTAVVDEQKQQDSPSSSSSTPSPLPLSLPSSSNVVIYFSGEESKEQISDRAHRMGMGNNPNILLRQATRLEDILANIATYCPTAVIIDSIQTVYLDEITSSAGSIPQVRECASALNQVAKREKIPIFLVGHVNKAGEIAGPRVLEHIVDVFVFMEGGRQQPVRLVRTQKNRHGANNEVGVFSMEERGMVPVPDPSRLFLSSRYIHNSSSDNDDNSTYASSGVGSAVAVEMEGRRPMLKEVQALCSPSYTSYASGGNSPPTRSLNGVKMDQLRHVLAVLGKHTPLKPHTVDVFFNVTGGLQLNEPAAGHLATAMAIVSSYCDRPIPHDVALIGELGLGGELRVVPYIERRVGEAGKLGFRKIVVPKGSDVKGKVTLGPGCEVVECRTIGEAIDKVLGVGALKKKKGSGNAGGARQVRQRQHQQRQDEWGEEEEEEAWADEN